MASSKVMASSSSTSANSDLARQSSIYSLTIAELQSDQGKNFGSMNMDELLRNTSYGDNPTATATATAEFSHAADGESNSEKLSLSRPGSFSLSKIVGSKTVDEVWKEIAATGSYRKDRDVDEEDAQYYKETEFEEMTLEDFLAKAGAVREEDVRIPVVTGPARGFFAVDPMLSNQFQQQQEQQQQQQQQRQQLEGSILGLDNGVVGGRRGKRRAVLEPVDRVAQQRQRRMIKNRESAARSRERKQLYTNELESLVTQLEEQNAQLKKERKESTRERLKQLMEYLIPVEEKHRPPRVLRRVRSLHW